MPETARRAADGIKIIELAAGIGPSPYTSMLLADAGARGGVGSSGRPRVRPSKTAGAEGALLGPAQPEPVVGGHRSRRTPTPSGWSSGWSSRPTGSTGLRPGVTERMGLGPDACWARNKALVYGRMTGWGQDGPMAQAAGHDIDYIGIGGALWSIGRADSPPVPPLNLVGDFGGGGLLLAFGMVAAFVEAARSGQGQVVDAAMVDGAASLMTMMFSFHTFGIWNEESSANMLDTGAPYYEVYGATADGKCAAVGGMGGWDSTPS